MINEISKNIAAYRKKLNMTQEELARKLNISFQAVSKWENGLSMPDITLLADLAAVLESDINALMGYQYTRKQISYYEDKYKTENYYWGLEPSPMCLDVIKLKPPIKKYRLLDIGCGEGKNAVFFARNGYYVDAFDISDAGIDKTKRLAEKCYANVNVFKANILDYRLEYDYDIIFSSGVFNYIPDNIRTHLLDDYRYHTVKNGFHFLNVFIKKPFIKQAPEKESNSTIWKSGELAGFYSDWLLHEMTEFIFDCNSSGVAHKHCMDKLVAQKIIVE